MFVYADNAATTSVSKTALDAMLPFLTENFGNPSSLYRFARVATDAVADARATIASCIGAEPRDIIFTSGGSEADNQAIMSAARLGAKKGKKHIISTTFEHHAVLHTLKRLEKDGYEITLLDVHEDGIVRVDELRDAIREDTALVTVMLLFLIIYCLTGKEKLIRPVKLCLVFCVAFSLFPLLFGIQYFSWIGALITVCLAVQLWLFDRYRKRL